MKTFWIFAAMTAVLVAVSIGQIYSLFLPPFDLVYEVFGAVLALLNGFGAYIAGSTALDEWRRINKRLSK